MRLRLTVGGRLRYAQAAGVHADLPHHGPAVFPAVLAQIIRHAANCIRLARAQIDLLVAVVAHRVLHDAARQELRNADRAGVGAEHGGRIDLRIARPHQVVFEILAEGRLTIRAIGGIRVVEGERGQRVEHTEVAHEAPVDRLHADDADDHFRRHAEFFIGALQRGLVGAPEAHAGVDAHRVEKARLIHAPVLDGRGGRRRHELDCGSRIAHAREQGMQRGFVEVIARRHVADERVDVRIIRVALRNDLFFEGLALRHRRLRLALREQQRLLRGALRHRRTGCHEHARCDGQCGGHGLHA